MRDADNYWWVGILIEFAFDADDPTHLQLRGKGIVTPTDERSVDEIPNLATIPRIELGWRDIDTEFNPDQYTPLAHLPPSV